MFLEFRPDWIQDEWWKDLLHYWATDPTFLKRSENGKAARASVKGGSLHTSGATSQVDLMKRLELQRGQAVPQDEIFKITHTRKEKNADGTDRWVEPRAERTWNEFQQHFGEFRATQPSTTQMTDELIQQQWIEKVAPPTRHGTVYGMPNRAFRRYPSALEAVGVTDDGTVDPKEYEAMKASS
ncbi:uncharacterized protein LOC132045422 [Lycium ferocissimum]|uniref:uncharacterized protein LOC132045422 n=1 Tax=Lycium ferocissimum TaxID=112874 RepID=UPI00281562F2|nr:uncharacterized protein LOC132045422 [Lycium ferocissimum]